MHGYEGIEKRKRNVTISLIEHNCLKEVKVGEEKRFETYAHFEKILMTAKIRHVVLYKQSRRKFIE